MKVSAIVTLDFGDNISTPLATVREVVANALKNHLDPIVFREDGKWATGHVTVKLLDSEG